MIFNLPHGIVIETAPGGGASIQSNLREDILGDEDDGADEQLLGAIEGIESLLLALAGAGVDLSDERFSAAVEDAVAAVCDNLG